MTKKTQTAPETISLTGSLWDDSARGFQLNPGGNYPPPKARFLYEDEETVYETPHFIVTVHTFTAGADHDPAELRKRFTVWSKRYGVILAHSSLEGESKLLAAQAEAKEIVSNKLIAQAEKNGFDQLDPDAGADLTAPAPGKRH